MKRKLVYILMILFSISLFSAAKMNRKSCSYECPCCDGDKTTVTTNTGGMNTREDISVPPFHLFLFSF